MTILFISLSYGLILFSLLSGWYLVAAVALVLTSLRWTSLPVLVLGVLLDGYYGFFFSVPIWSLGAVGWCIVVELLRPIIRDQWQPL